MCRGKCKNKCRVSVLSILFCGGGWEGNVNYSVDTHAHTCSHAHTHTCRVPQSPLTATTAPIFYFWGFFLHNRQPPSEKHVRKHFKNALMNPSIPGRRGLIKAHLLHGDITHSLAGRNVLTCLATTPHGLPSLLYDMPVTFISHLRGGKKRGCVLNIP